MEKITVDESQSIIRMEYKGWKIVAHHQVHIPPFKDYVAIVTKEKEEKIVGFNREGNSLKEVISHAVSEIERRISNV